MDDVGESTSSGDFESFRNLAEQGDAAAQYELGNAYYYSDNVEANYSEALNWYREAAEQALVEARYFLGYPARRVNSLIRICLKRRTGSAKSPNKNMLAITSVSKPNSFS